jgi:hypothetical protein
MERVSLTWQALEKSKNFLSAPAFSLYTSRKPVRCTGKLFQEHVTIFYPCMLNEMDCLDLY